MCVYLIWTNGEEICFACGQCSATLTERDVLSVTGKMVGFSSAFFFS